MRVDASPKARVFIDGKLVGVSPTKPVEVTGQTVTVRLEHEALGSKEFQVNVVPGKTTDVNLRW